jgi:aminoglycoside 6'-N-acetyltransferase I
MTAFAKIKDMIQSCVSTKQRGWLKLRQALWTDVPAKEHLEEMSELLANPQHHVQFVVYDESKQALGFVEASIRTEYVNGTNTSPVAFLEGIYVLPTARQQGIAARLIAAVSAWAIEAGCHEIASDALLENTISHTVHQKLGFEETERVVFFCKPLR